MWHEGMFFFFFIFQRVDPPPLTFEEVGSKASLVDGAIWNKFHPQVVGAGFDVIWFVVATEAAKERAVFRVAITHLQVVIGTTVMSLNLWNVKDFEV